MTQATSNQSTVQRLRTQKQEAQRDTKECAGHRRARKSLGYETGKTWAEDHAALGELQRLGESSESESQRVRGACLRYMLDTDDRDDLAEFWRESVGLDDEDRRELTTDENWLFGFYAGAVDVWDSIKDRI